MHTDEIKVYTKSILKHWQVYYIHIIHVVNISMNREFKHAINKPPFLWQIKKKFEDLTIW